MRIYLFKFLVLLPLLFSAFSLQAQQTNPPDGIKIDRFGRSIHKRFTENAPEEYMANYNVNDNIYVFPCCTDGKIFYSGIQLAYVDEAFSVPTSDWKFDLTFDLYINGSYEWTYTLGLDMGAQKIATLIFHDEAENINPATSYIKVKNLVQTESPPLANLKVSAVLYEEGISYQDPSTMIPVTYNPGDEDYIISWTDNIDNNSIVEEYELEWVFVDADEEAFTGSPFDYRTPARVSTKSLSYKIDQLFTSGLIYYRVRRVSYLPDNPDHRIYSLWNEGQSATAAFFTNDNDNWQQVITFAEDGKNKKVLTYYDGTLRPVQTMTNLNHEQSTLISESKYDFEGRKVLDVLPHVINGWDPKNFDEKVIFNSKSDYDNGSAVNTLPSFDGANDYYNNHPDLSVPRANGYTYAQTHFQRDNSSRVTKQSGVGETFHIDGGRNTNFFYGTASRKELTNLFGETNIGINSHYRKILSQDPNNQVSVTYLDPQGRTIATALAGEAPPELDELPTNITQNPITVDLSNHYTTDEKGTRTTFYKLLNVAVGTEYTFDYLLSATGENYGTPAMCLDCTFDLSIKIIDPAGVERYSLSQENLNTDNCAGLTVDPIISPLTFNEVGEYTIIKSIVPHKPSYEEALAIVTSFTEVQQTITSIATSEPAVDPTFCDIELGGQTIGELLAEIPEIARDVYQNQCLAIRTEIINDLRSASATMTFDEIDADFENLAAGHERYCEYQFCQQNIESDVFEAKLFVIDNWADANLHGFANPLEIDDFFNVPGLAGLDYKAAMQSFLNSYTVNWNGQNITGSLINLVNPDYAPMKAVDEFGNTVHLLYAEIERRDDSQLEKAAAIDQLKWRYYRAYYLEAKNRIKQQIAFAISCTSLAEKFNEKDPFTYLGFDGNMTSGEILNYTMDGWTFIEDITEAELDIKIQQLEERCGVSFSESHKTQIRNVLETFFNEHPLNILRIIPLEIISSPPFDVIETILQTYGCSLSAAPFVYSMNSSDPDCPFCNPFVFQLNFLISQYEFNCNQDQASIREDKIRIKQEEFLHEQVTEFLRGFNCGDNITETFDYTYEPKEYHYTLYYFDRAGNLVQTIPPVGVNTGGPGVHSYKTNYYYNSLSQLVRQSSPDGGTTGFIYDKKGQLRISQNAEQLVDEDFSYTKYDKQGRIIEVGQLNTPLELEDFQGSTILENTLFPEPETYNLAEFSKTYYDLPANRTDFQQENVRGRVSHVELYEDEQTLSSATYYSYDVHGNVKSLLQVIDGFSPKRVDYAYDLISGNVNYVIYQYDEDDQFYHHYSYDGDNRLTLVETSVDGVLWNREAEYRYHKHGPLKRLEIGDGQNLQGLDYYYTLQGWLKGMNAPLTNDPGDDENNNFSRDVVGFNLGYYADDFEGGDFGSGDKWTDLDARDKLWERNQETNGHQGLYNGNISIMNTWLKGVGDDAGDDAQGMQAMLYKYDQLNRIKRARGLSQYQLTTGYASRGEKDKYDSDYIYDGNGNILELDRKDHNELLTDSLLYTYEPGNNRLLFVNGTGHEVKNYGGGAIVDDGNIYPNIVVDGDASVPVGESVTLKATESITLNPGFEVKAGGDFEGLITDEAPTTDFEIGNYQYDPIGNLIRDETQGTNIDWTVYGKVDKVRKDGGNVTDFTYDPSGNRVKKVTTTTNGSSSTFYIRDASGNIMAVYEQPSGQTEVELKETPIYGSSRLGEYRGNSAIGSLYLGQRRYEVSNHLGNVLSTLSDELKVDENGEREVVVTSASDYYPFGLQMPGRNLSSTSYRYGFNGKEKDDKGEFGSTVYDYGFRIYNPQIARFLSVDPLTKSYPWYTPYQFAGNKPIRYIDLDGLEEYDPAWEMHEYNIPRLFKTSFYDIKHAIFNVSNLVIGSETRARYKVNENNHEIFETEYYNREPPKDLKTVAVYAFEDAVNLTEISGVKSFSAKDLIPAWSLNITQLTRGLKQGFRHLGDNLSLGNKRENLVADLTNGSVAEVDGKDLVVKSLDKKLGATVDVVGESGELITVGGANKANSKKRSAFLSTVSTLKKIADENGTVAKAYLAKNTPGELVKKVEDKLGTENVVIFDDPL